MGKGDNRKTWKMKRLKAKAAKKGKEQKRRKGSEAQA